MKVASRRWECNLSKGKKAPQSYKQHRTKFYEQPENLEADSPSSPPDWEFRQASHLDLAQRDIKQILRTLS